ncbi:HupE/UreJ family protein [Aliiglaciecola sp.]|nr:HupE/UreJ family protein [Aliiglaciecola sp.]
MVRRQLMNWNILLCLFVLIASAGATIKAHAHAMEQSYIFLSISDTSIDGRLEMTIEDLNNAMNLSLPLDKSVTQAQIQPHIEDIKAYFDQHISMGFRDGIKLDDFFLHSIPASQYIAINFGFENVETIPEYIDFTYSVLFDKDSNHLGMVIIENDWRAGVFNDEANVALIFKPSNTKKRLDLTDATVMQGYWEMLKLGIHHILEGIDHVLFLIALLLPAVVVRAHREWQPAPQFYPAFIYVVKVVTVFTLAHTITLSAATLGVLSLPSRLVESIIAISIAIAALDILYPVFRGRIWLIVFVFGLFHGFGFASVLAEYNIPDSYLTWSLLSFNLGVEVGQVAIILVVFPILYLLRQFAIYQLLFLKAGASLLILVSLYWFIERGFEIDLPAGAVMNWFLALLGIA